MVSKKQNKSFSAGVIGDRTITACSSKNFLSAKSVKPIREVWFKLLKLFLKLGSKFARLCGVVIENILSLTRKSGLNVLFAEQRLISGQKLEEIPAFCLSGQFFNYRKSLDIFLIFYTVRTSSSGEVGNVKKSRRRSVSYKTRIILI